MGLLLLHPSFGFNSVLGKKCFTPSYLMAQAKQTHSRTKKSQRRKATGPKSTANITLCLRRTGPIKVRLLPS
uniref:Uncharacterized protein n=4 Tax=Cercopithecinae TaxID=9528 RepID=A0A2K5NV03_CERAT|nr:unnamed protein product [Macaca fascicularis]